MKVEKKVIPLSICALAIGIANILPLAYFTGSNTPATGQSWFNVDISSAYISLYETGENSMFAWDGVIIEAVTNCTLKPEAIALKNTDARIEFYMFNISSEQGSIVNMSYSIAVSKGTKDISGESVDQGVIKHAGSNNCYFFADGTMYDGSAIMGDSVWGGSTHLSIIPRELLECKYVTKDLRTSIMNYKGSIVFEALNTHRNEVIPALRSAHTIYIEVSRVCYVSYQTGTKQEPATTRVTLTDNEVLGYIELTRIEDGFIYGESVERPLSRPVRTPALTSLILQLPSIHKLKPFITTYELQSFPPFGSNTRNIWC